MKPLLYALLMTALSTPLAWGQITYDWSKVRMGGPEQANTMAEGTNDAGWIVGNYRWLNGTQPARGAFRFQKGKFYEFTERCISSLSFLR